MASIRGSADRVSAAGSVLVLCLAVCACTHRVVTVHDPIPTPTPSIRATLQRQVQNAVDAGEGDLELRQLRARVAASPDDVEVRLKLAAHYGARGLSDLEIEHCRLAAARFPDSTAAALALAKALRASDAIVEARDGLAKFCKIHPDAPASLFSLVGVLEDGLGNHPSAEPWHKAAIERAPSSGYLHNNLGYNLFLQQREAEAAAEFRRALELNPGSEIARNNLGLALAANPEQAMGEWQSVNGPAAAHNNMGAVLIGQKRYADARREIEAALKISPKQPAALENLKLLAELDGKGASGSRERGFRQRVFSVFRKPSPAPPAGDETAAR